MNVEIQAPSKDNLEFVMSTEWIWADDDANDCAVFKFIGNLGYYLGRSDITLLNMNWKSGLHITNGETFNTKEQLGYSRVKIDW